MTFTGYISITDALRGQTSKQDQWVLDKYRDPKFFEFCNFYDNNYD